MPLLTMSKGYNSDVEALRQKEYPHMNNGVYLDHSGATIYAKSTVDSFCAKMVTNLYGNPHSENFPAKLSGDVVDQVREKTLNFLGANPEHFDLIFVANATAAIKLVADSFRDLSEKTSDRRFWYGYHKDSHTSIVGVRELAYGQSYCFRGDQDVERWLRSPESSFVNCYHPGGLGLFAYPGQSNMSGRRLPLSWPGILRQSEYLQNTYTLLDAAALAMTYPMETIFRDVDHAPDFTCLSLYKIFGFPDIGALIVRKESGHILTLRKYFGGGTVSMVATFGENWHRSKGLQAPTYKLHEGLEDGTLPFHSILALGEAIDVHKKLYGSMSRISDHTSYLISRLCRGMATMRHSNGRPVCRIYNENGDFENPAKQGSAIAFNILRANGHHVPYSDVERSANSAGIYIRSGGVCNPGGIFTALGYEPWMTERALSAGHHCGSHGISIIHRLPTGIVRASLGAMSTKKDVDTFLDFLRTTFLEDDEEWPAKTRTTIISPRSEAFTLDLPVDYTTSNFPDVREVPRPRPVPHHFSSAPEATPRITSFAMNDLINNLAAVK
ncbi:PLP-dependent transferase [Annulohypoxylon bovei var. microspora]|nr:PLP-dependent transferase [Annulohypoxylon bovei var. microspora]